MHFTTCSPKMSWGSVRYRYTRFWMHGKNVARHKMNNIFNWVHLPKLLILQASNPFEMEVHFIHKRVCVALCVNSCKTFYEWPMYNISQLVLGWAVNLMRQTKFVQTFWIHCTTAKAMVLTHLGKCDPTILHSLSYALLRLPPDICVLHIQSTIVK